MESDKINKIEKNKEIKTKKINYLKKQLIKLSKYYLYIIHKNEYDLKNMYEDNNHDHRNREDTKKEFKKQRYYYIGYINDIKYIISNCPKCYQK